MPKQAMSWTREKQVRLDLLREQDLAVALTDAERGELNSLIAEIEAEEAATLAPAMAKQREEIGALQRQIQAVEIENEELAKLLAQQEQLAADVRRLLAEFDRRCASIQEGVDRLTAPSSSM
jgi:predicted RNase H-like nuclease (RuvC/YqgF family)